MHLNVLTDYALRLLIALAVRPGERQGLGDIADRYAISRDHLRKISQRLSAAGMVKSWRGRGGGVGLAKATTEITVAEVVRIMEPDMAVVECLGNSSACRIEPVCRLKGVFARARSAFFQELEAVTLADCVSNTAELRGQLGLPSD